MMSCDEQSLVLDLTGCPSDCLDDKTHILAWCQSVMQLLGVASCSPPLVECFEEEATEGITLLQLSSDVDLCAHFSATRQAAYIDVCSTKAFGVSEITALCETYFKPLTITTKELFQSDDACQQYAA